MNLYYALGGGLGHLVRARAFTATLGIEADTVVLASTPAADDQRITGPLPVLRPTAAMHNDPVRLRTWLDEIIVARGARTLYVDAFPAGILGELADWTPPPGLQLNHVARIVGADSIAAAARAPGPRYHTTYLTEEISAEQRDFLQHRSRELQSLVLQDPEPDPESRAAVTERRAWLQCEHPRFWLVVHSGPAEEIGELVRFAADLRAAEQAAVDLVVFAPQTVAALPPRTWCVDQYPAHPFFPSAERIISAAGFNVVRQAARWRERHVLHPFPRRHDDQFARALLARSGTWGVAARG